MNPRLEKLRQEREKLAEKLTSLTARLKALDEQILKLENTDIVGIVRENGLTIEQLAALMEMLEKRPTAAIWSIRQWATRPWKPQLQLHSRRIRIPVSRPQTDRP